MNSQGIVFAAMFVLSLYVVWPRGHPTEVAKNADIKTEVRADNLRNLIVDMEGKGRDIISLDRAQRNLDQPSTDEELEASSCFTCFAPAWGWYMGPFSGEATFSFDMFSSNTNGCTREDGDSATLSGKATLKVADKNNDGELEFEVIVETERKIDYDETQIYIDTLQPPSNRPPPGKDSSKCYAAGGSDATCVSASGNSQVHKVDAGTATLQAISKSDQYYVWIHAAEDYTGETVYARSDLAKSCSEVAISTSSSPVQEPVPSPTMAQLPVPTRSPALPLTPTVSPVQPTSSGSCFHGDGTVQLQSGESKSFADLQLGEKILTSDKDGKFSFSPIIVLPHAKNNEPAAFLTLTTDSGKTVDMTSDHLIPKCNEFGKKEVSAGDLTVGDCLVTVDGKETLSAISWSSKNGVYTAIAENKYIVVNGVVASPFSKNSNLVHPERDYDKYRLELEEKRVGELIRETLKESVLRRHLHL